MVASGRGVSALSKLFARYTPECSRLIAKLPAEIKRLVRSTIDALLTKHEMGTELVGELDGYRSYRVRRYRIIYRVNDEESCLEVYHVGHRRDVYETLRSLLSRKRERTVSWDRPIIISQYSGPTIPLEISSGDDIFCALCL